MALKTQIYSRMRGENRAVARAYLLERMTTPDAGSDFERAAGCMVPLLKLPGMLVVGARLAEPYLLRKGYDALVLKEGTMIRGHTTFQVHDDLSLHVFACEVDPSIRGRGFGLNMSLDVIDEARRRGLRRVRIGGGNHPATNRIHQKLQAHESIEGFEVLDDNWVEIVYGSPRLYR